PRSPRASSPRRSATTRISSRSRRCARWCRDAVPTHSAVMRGPGPRTPLRDAQRLPERDGRDKPGHDGASPTGPAMTYIAKPKFHHPGLPKNSLGYTHRDYEGKISTLCAGCGHDSITAAIIEACFHLSIEPHRVAKISGIGCSSKTPDYFLGNSHGFNSVHGRMPSVLTGANLANRDLIYLGVSGDGD